MIISSLVFSITVSLQIKGQIEQEYDLVKLNALVPHGPINITSDTDFVLVYDFPGEGSAAVPYLIDNLNITTTDVYGINIEGVTKFFKITNCFVKAQTPINIDGVSVSSTLIQGNSLISTNHLTSCFNLINCYNFNLIDNSLYGPATAGILADTCFNLWIEESYFTGFYNSIETIDCMWVDVYSNFFEGNDGDQYVGTENLEFYNNTWYNNNYGLYLGDCTDGNVTGNYFFENTYFAVTTYMVLGCRVYNNWFVDNNLLDKSQVKQELSSTGWSYNGIGNFWSDYSGSGYYWIEGDNYDYYPIFDTDNDGLNEYDEVFVYLTDRYNPDSDGDLMPDGFEVDNGLNPLLDDASEDPDNDDLTNLNEYYFGTLAQDEDTDDDLIFDGYEVIHSLNPLFDDSWLDLDGDGLTNLQEYQLGTKANNDDSDNDGMNDYWEDDNGLDPLINDAWDDPDNDLLNNFLEYIYGCDPFSNDTDGDSHIDSWEVAHGTNPNDSSDYPDEIFETVTEESPFNFVYVVLSLIALSGLFIFKRRR